MSQDLRTQPSKPCTSLPMNTGCVNPLAAQGVLIPLKANTISQGLFHTKNLIYAWGSMCWLILSMLSLSCASQHAWILLQWPDTEPAPRLCLVLMPPLACYTWHPTDTCKLQQMATPRGILPIHTTDFPLLQCPLLALGSLPSILNAEEKLSLLNPWSMSSCTALLHSLNKSVIIWLQFDLHITLFPCHFTRWIGNLRTSQEKPLLISIQCSFPEH